QPKFVTVLTMDTVIGPQLLVTNGGLKVRLFALHSLVLFGPQVMTGPIVSTWAIVWLHVLLFPQGSDADQVRVATNVLPQPKLVTVLTMDTVIGPQLLVTNGGLKVRLPAPHSLVLFWPQMMTGPMVSAWTMV